MLRSKATRQGSARKGPQRFDDRRELQRAVEAHCEAEIGPQPHLADVRAMVEDAAGRDITNRLRAALHDAQAHLRGPHKETYYAEELRRVVEAVRDAVAMPPRGDDGEIALRRQLVVMVDTPRRSPRTNREVACLSCLAGNGSEWARVRIKRARDERNPSLLPTVLDVVRAEERAIAIMRERVAEEASAAQARAREADEARAAAERRAGRRVRAIG